MLILIFRIWSQQKLTRHGNLWWIYNIRCTTRLIAFSFHHYQFRSLFIATNESKGLSSKHRDKQNLWLSVGCESEFAHEMTDQWLSWSNTKWRHFCGPHYKFDYITKHLGFPSSTPGLWLSVNYSAKSRPMNETRLLQEKLAVSHCGKSNANYFNRSEQHWRHWIYCTTHDRQVG